MKGRRWLGVEAGLVGMECLQVTQKLSIAREHGRAKSAAIHDIPDTVRSRLNEYVSAVDVVQPVRSNKGERHVIKGSVNATAVNECHMKGWECVRRLAQDEQYGKKAQGIIGFFTGF